MELSDSNRYFDSTEAFWAAEAAINRFIQNTALLDDGDQTLQFGLTSVFLQKDDSSASTRVVTATATDNSVERTVTVEFPADIPSLYDNTLSSGGDAYITGIAGVVDFEFKQRDRFMVLGIFTYPQKIVVFCRIRTKNAIREALIIE